MGCDPPTYCPPLSSTRSRPPPPPLLIVLLSLSSPPSPSPCCCCCSSSSSTWYSTPVFPPSLLIILLLFPAVLLLVLPFSFHPVLFLLLLLLLRILLLLFPLPLLLCRRRCGEDVRVWRYIGRPLGLGVPRWPAMPSELVSEDSRRSTHARMHSQLCAMFVVVMHDRHFPAPEHTQSSLVVVRCSLCDALSRLFHLAQASSMLFRDDETALH